MVVVENLIALQVLDPLYGVAFLVVALISLGGDEGNHFMIMSSMRR